VQSVVEHFTSKYGAEVTITIDVEARHRDGFDATLARVVKENASVLRFRSADFEDE
jgi:hypothetical protein